MSVRVAYIQREARGTAIVGARLVSVGSEETYRAPVVSAVGAGVGGLGAGGDAVAEVEALADWLARSVATQRGADPIGMVCLDISGAACAWMNAPSLDSEVMAIVSRQGGAGGSSDGSEAGYGARNAVEFFAPSRLDSTAEALGESGLSVGVGANKRVAVLAATDAPARVLVDSLDRRGTPAESVGTIWHAMALAWCRPSASGGGDAVGEGQERLSAAVMVEPETARLLWCWSRGNKDGARVLAAGSVRLRRPVQETVVDADGASTGSLNTGENAVAFTRADVSRVVSDWLGWSAQMGVSPSRIVCVVPEADGGAEGAGGEELLTSRQFGAALAAAWRGATLDMAVHDDPVGATLRRVATFLDSQARGALAAQSSAEKAKGAGDSSRVLTGLSSRFGYSHRKMYRWVALSLGVVAVCVGVAGWRLGAAATEADAKRVAFDAKWKEEVSKVEPGAFKGIGVNRSAFNIITEEVKRLEKQLKPVDVNESGKPLLREFETLSLVLGASGVDVESVKLDEFNPQVVILAPSTAEAEAVLDALRKIGGSDLVDWTATFQQANTKVRGVFSAKWGVIQKSLPPQPPKPTGGA